LFACPDERWERFACNSLEALSTFAGSLGGFAAGGGGGALLAVATGGAASPLVPAAAYAGAAAGAAAGLAAGKRLTDALFAKSDGELRGGKQKYRDRDFMRLKDEFAISDSERDAIHLEIGKQKKGAGNLEYDELRNIFIDITGRNP
jgi:hypothetical protein